MDSSVIKILVVEDERLAQLVAKTLLQQLDCQADIASSGNEALGKANEITYDIIFMDLGLGNTDGFTITKAIKTKSKNLTTPIVALTAHHITEQQQQAKAVGMIDFVTKPLEKSLLIEILTKYTPHYFAKTGS